MGNPVFRFTLSNSTVGTKIISEPDGWKKAVLKLERHPDFHSLVEYFEGDFVFYGTNGINDGGLDFILNVENRLGFNAELIIIIDISHNDGEDFENVFTGQLDLPSLEHLPDNKISLPIIKDSLWAKFIARRHIPVDLFSLTDLDGNQIFPVPEVVVNLTPQIILKQTSYTGHTGEGTTVDDCQAATTANITLSGLQTIDGVAITQGQRVLVKNQTDQTTNGVYNASSGSWTRTPDANTSLEVENSISTIILGTVNASKTFKQQTGSVTLGSSNIVYAEYNFVDDFILYEDSGAFSDVTFYTQGQSADATIEEIKEGFHLPFIGQETFTDLNVLEMVNDAGELEGTWNIGMALTLYIIDTSGEMGNANWTISLYTKLNEETPILVDEYTITQTVGSTIGGLPRITFTLSGTHTFTVNTGDLISSYIKYRIVFPGSETVSQYRVYGGITASDVTFKINSIFPETTAQGYLLHDAIAGVLERITGQRDIFYSEILGSPRTKMRAYPENGCHWPMFITKGLQLRGYTIFAKPPSWSFDDLWNGANPIFNLGFGYDTISGTKLLRLEKKEHYYDNSTTSVNIDDLDKPTRQYDESRIFTKIETGFEKWQSEDIRGLDDPQTKHTYSTIVQKKISDEQGEFGGTLTVHSKFIAASIAIEVTRRKSVELSKDFKFDNDTFIIALNTDDVSPDRYQPELLENFTLVTGLLNPTTRYNIRLTPARALLRWINVANSGLQKYLSSTYKFTQGEGNYTMASTMTADGCRGDNSGVNLVENQNISVTTNYITLPDRYESETDLKWESYSLIRNSAKLAVNVSRTESNHRKFFIKMLQYYICEAKAKLSIWGYNVNPSDFMMPITTTPGEFPDKECVTYHLLTPIVNLFGDSSICDGEIIHYYTTIENGGCFPIFTWLVNGVAIPGETENTLDISTLSNGDTLQVILTSDLINVTSQTAYSNIITITENPSRVASVSISTASTSVCSGASVTFTPTPVNGGPTPGYEWYKNGVFQTGLTNYVTSSLADGDQIQVYMESSFPCTTPSPALSNVITMSVTTTVTPSVSISASPSNVIESGESVTFTATPTNGGTPSYQWKKNGSNVGTNSNTYSSSTLANGDVITCVMTSSLTCTSSNPVTSNSITMDVLTGTLDCGGGGSTGSYTTLNSFHVYPVLTYDLGFATGTATLIYDAFGNPNRFTVKEYPSGNTVATTGWVGSASFTGPWGAPPFSVTPNGTLNFSKSTSTQRFYTLTVETQTGPVDTDGWSATIDCPV